MKKRKKIKTENSVTYKGKNESQKNTDWFSTQKFISNKTIKSVQRQGHWQAWKTNNIYLSYMFYYYDTEEWGSKPVKVQCLETRNNITDWTE